jgi:hypothetical protein
MAAIFVIALVCLGALVIPLVVLFGPDTDLANSIQVHV